MTVPDGSNCMSSETRVSWQQLPSSRGCTPAPRGRSLLASLQGKPGRKSRWTTLPAAESQGQVAGRVTTAILGRCWGGHEPGLTGQPTGRHNRSKVLSGPWKVLISAGPQAPERLSGPGPPAKLKLGKPAGLHSAHLVLDHLQNVAVAWIGGGKEGSQPNRNSIHSVGRAGLVDAVDRRREADRGGEQ